jgi:hypothetical protein
MIAKGYDAGNSIVSKQECRVRLLSFNTVPDEGGYERARYGSLVTGIDSAGASVALTAIAAGMRMTCLPGGVTPR